jgi:hypothetical protein
MDQVPESIMDSSNVYNVMVPTPFGGEYFGNLIIGNQEALFGKFFFGSSCEYALRCEDEITLGYISKKEGKEVKKDTFQINLPEKYNSEKLFKKVPNNFTEKLKSMSYYDSKKLIETRNGFYHAMILAGKKRV